MNVWNEVWAGDVKAGDVMKVPWNLDGERVESVSIEGRRVCLSFKPTATTYYDWDHPVRVKPSRPRMAVLGDDLVRQAFEVAVQTAAPDAVNWLNRHPRDPERYCYDRIETQFRQFRALFGANQEH